MQKMATTTKAPLAHILRVFAAMLCVLFCFALPALFYKEGAGILSALLIFAAMVIFAAAFGYLLLRLIFVQIHAAKPWPRSIRPAVLAVLFTLVLAGGVSFLLALVLFNVFYAGQGGGSFLAGDILGVAINSFIYPVWALLILSALQHANSSMAAFGGLFKKNMRHNYLRLLLFSLVLSVGSTLFAQLVGGLPSLVVSVVASALLWLLSTLQFYKNIDKEELGEEEEEESEDE